MQVSSIFFENVGPVSQSSPLMTALIGNISAIGCFVSTSQQVGCSSKPETVVNLLLVRDREKDGSNVLSVSQSVKFGNLFVGSIHSHNNSELSKKRIHVTIVPSQVNSIVPNRIYVTP